MNNSNKEEKGGMGCLVLAVAIIGALLVMLILSSLIFNK